MNSRTKNILFWVVVGLFMILLFNLFSVPHHEPEEDVIFSEFMTKLDKGEVERVIIKASHISAVLKDKTRIRTYSVEYPELVQVLRDRGVQIEAKPPDEPSLPIAVQPSSAMVQSWPKGNCSVLIRFWRGSNSKGRDRVDSLSPKEERTLRVRLICPVPPTQFLW